MLDGLSVTRDKIYKGAARVVVSDPTTLTSFPGRMESVINPATPVSGTAYALATGWSDVGPTTEDGVTLTREAELADGIPVSQRAAALDEGEPESWSMAAEMTLLETTLERINLAWAAGTLRSHDADAGHVAQRSLTVDAPSSFTERMCAIIQEDVKTGALRVFVFRKATPKVDGAEITFHGTEASDLPFNLTIKADTDVAQGSGQFGVIFSEGADG